MKQSTKNLISIALKGRKKGPMLEETKKKISLAKTAKFLVLNWRNQYATAN